MSEQLPPRAPEYLDFDLEIDQLSGNAYKLSVLASPAGGATGSMLFPFDEAALHARLAALQAALIPGAPSAPKPPAGPAPGQTTPQPVAATSTASPPAQPGATASNRPDPQAALEFGGALMQALFVDPLRGAYDSSVMKAIQAGKRLRLRLRIQDAALATLPWEFLFDAQQHDYLVLGRRLSLVRYLDVPQPAPALGITPPLRILAMAAGPSDLPTLDASREKQLMQAALAGLLQDGLVEITWLDSGSWRDLQQALREQTWHIFHFSGHGGFSASAGDGLLAFVGDDGKKQILQAQDVGRLLADHPTLRLAVLNACEGAESSQTDLYSSTAASLVAHGVPAVIAMRYEITDAAAIEFGRSLYEAIADELPIDAAVSEARIGVSIALRHTLEWGTPVLFMRATDSALFHLTARPPQPPQTNTPLPPCPYRGLFAFREEDAARFFGRDPVTEQLVSATLTRGLTAVIGPSGSGKSSVVYAGLVPKLRAAGGWLILNLRPGAQPFDALSAALLPVLEPQLSEAEQQSEREKLAGALQQGQASLASVAQRLLVKTPDAHKLLLIIDQFEELYTLGSDAAERDAFIAAVLALSGSATDPSTLSATAVLTLRADFYGAALSNRALSDALQTAALNLGPMTTAELQEAIARPALQRGVRFEAGLIDRLLTEISGGAGELPLLQFALTELWAQQRAGSLTHAAYEAMGGVGQALAGYAETTFAALSSAEQAQAQRIFVQLVQPGDGTADTRRQATRDEIGPDNWTLVVKLADARLLVTGRSAAGEDTVEVVHEALIAGWARLQSWINADRSFRLWQERLRAALRQWEASKRDAGALLRGAPLVEAEQWLAQRSADLSPQEQAFIRDGIDQRRKELLARERLRRGITLGSVAAACVLLVVAGLAVIKWRDANHQRDVATARQLATQSVGYSILKPDLALLLSLEAVHLANTAEVETNLRDRLADNAQLSTTLYVGATAANGLLPGVYCLAFSSDGTMLASGSGDSAIQLWDSTKRTLRRTLAVADSSAQVVGVAFSPDGKTLISVSSNNDIRLWDVASGTLLAPVSTTHATVQSAALSHDGATLATGRDDGTIQLWDIASRQPLGTPIAGQGGPITALAFSPNDALLASRGSRGAIQLWNVTDRTQITGFMDESDGGQLAFSPDGATLALGDTGSVKLWSVAQRSISSTLPSMGVALSVAFSPDGTTVAAGNSDHTIQIWNIASTKLLSTLTGHSGWVYSEAFSPNGTTLASGSSDSTIRLWNASQPALFGVSLSSQNGAIVGVVYSPDGKLLAARTHDSVQLWDVASRKPFGVPMAGQNSPTGNMTFSADGKLLLWANGSALQIWDVASQQPHGVPLSLGRAPANVAFSGDGAMFAFGTGDAAITLWSATDLSLKATLDNGPAELPMAFSPDGTLLVSSSINNTYHLWNVASRTVVGTLPGPSGPTGDVAFSLDGKLLATISAGSIQLWDVKTRQAIGAPLTGGASFVTSVAFSPDSKVLVSANSDRTIRFWDVVSHQPLGNPLTSNSGVEAVTFSADGKLLVSGNDMTMQLWVLDPAAWQAQACSIANRNLTAAEWQTFLPTMTPEKICAAYP